jgi:hypothetical protein
MRMNHAVSKRAAVRASNSLSALLLLGLPLLLGNKGCEADAHEADAEAANDGDQHAEDAGSVDPSDDAPLPGTPNVRLDAGSDASKPEPQPTRDASVLPGKDAGSGGTTSGRCGTRGGVTCAMDEFCQFEANTMCGAADQGGTCTKKPEVCTAIYKPVCGCDGKTYGSDCSANGAGVSVASQGECKGGPVIEPGPDGPVGKMCGGFAGLKCDSAQFCNYEVEAGGQGCDGIADGAGTCQATPKACTKEYAPVCGCDHHTYGTACEAHSKGVSVLHKGACNEIDCKTIGGRAVDGIGPAPKCASGETDVGAIVYSNGQMSIEGTICCVK